MSTQPAKDSSTASNIDEVIARLTEIIDRSRQTSSRLGFFASLYRSVTIEVKRGIENGRFQNGPLMEKLDVTFANRYLHALSCHEKGEPASKCWVFAFEVTKQWPPLVLQHLLIGMNAHINLDLGAAAAITCPGDEISGLKQDFDEINNILSAMTSGVQWRLSLINPWMKLLDRVSGKLDDAVMNWSIEVARKHAWSVATRLAPLNPEQMADELRKLDTEVDLLARLVRNPGWLLAIGALIARGREIRSIPKIIDILA